MELELQMFARMLKGRRHLGLDTGILRQGFRRLFQQATLGKPLVCGAEIEVINPRNLG